MLCASTAMNAEVKGIEVLAKIPVVFNFLISSTVFDRANVQERNIEVPYRNW